MRMRLRHGDAAFAHAGNRARGLLGKAAAIFSLLRRVRPIRPMITKGLASIARVLVASRPAMMRGARRQRADVLEVG